MKRLFLMLMLSLMLVFNIGAMTAYDIFYAEPDILSRASELRGLDGTLSADLMRKNLYEYEGLEAYTVEVDAEADEYKTEIVNADMLFAEDGFVFAEGNVEITVTSDEDQKTLSASSVIIDEKAETISALGDVHFTGDGEDISADIVTFYWRKGTLLVDNASTRTEKEDLSVYSVGSKLTFSPEGAVSYDDGYISSSVENPLSSIGAEKIVLLPEADMFIENAVLRIGRVPIFYFPFFFYPGNTMVGNPSFGFESTRGAFLNTTFEIFGSSGLIEEKEDSSFLAVFAPEAEKDSSYKPEGPIYVKREDNAGVEKWAASSRSHLALLFDAWSEVGIHAGLDAKLNFFDSKLRLSFVEGVGLTLPEVSPVDDENFRYYSENKLSYSDFGLTLNLDIPFYSDTTVMKDLMTRNTAFTLEPIFMQDVEFEDSKRSEITTINKKLSLSYSLPHKWTSSFLKSFRLDTIKAEMTEKWDEDESDWILTKALLPEVRLSMNGDVFNITGGKKKGDKKSSTVTTEEKKEEAVFSDPLLFPAYTYAAKTEAVKGGSWYGRMSWSLSETLNNELTFDKEGEKDAESISTYTKMSLKTDISLGEWFRLGHTLTPNFDWKKSEGSYVTVSGKAGMTSSLTLDIPYIGLSYKLTNDVFSWDRTLTDGEEKLDEHWAEWDKESVRTHSIGFSKAFRTPVGTFTPSITYTLDPLVGSLTPEFRYAKSPFSFGYSWRFNAKDGDGKGFDPDLMKMSMGYEGTYFYGSLSMRYQTKDWDKADFWAPFGFDTKLGLRTRKKDYSFVTDLSYTELTSKGERNSIDKLQMTLKVPYFSSAFYFSGADGLYEFDRVDLTLRLNKFVFQFWKGRVYVDLGLVSELDLDVQNLWSSSFSFSPSLTFSIAEFMDFTFSMKSINNNFGAYMEDEAFSFGLMWDDLMRSFDFFGEGRTKTNFNISSIALDCIHYMEDWQLHCKYSTSVVLSNNEYRYVPELSVFLSWSTFPDLKVEEKWHNKDGEEWTRRE